MVHRLSEWLYQGRALALRPAGLRKVMQMAIHVGPFALICALMRLFLTVMMEIMIQLDRLHLGKVLASPVV